MPKGITWEIFKQKVEALGVREDSSVSDFCITETFYSTLNKTVVEFSGNVNLEVKAEESQEGEKEK